MIAKRTRTYDVTFTLWGDIPNVSYRVRAGSRAEAISKARAEHRSSGNRAPIGGVSAVAI